MNQAEFPKVELPVIPEREYKIEEYGARRFTRRMRQAAAAS